MANLEIPLQPALADYVSTQAAAARTSPARYVQNLIRQQKQRDQTAVRAQVGYYLNLVEKEADQKGWLPLDAAFPARKK